MQPRPLVPAVLRPLVIAVMAWGALPSVQRCAGPAVGAGPACGLVANAPAAVAAAGSECAAGARPLARTAEATHSCDRCETGAMGGGAERIAREGVDPDAAHAPDSSPCPLSGARAPSGRRWCVGDAQTGRALRNGSNPGAAPPLALAPLDDPIARPPAQSARRASFAPAPRGPTDPHGRPQLPRAPPFAPAQTPHFTGVL